MASSLKNAAEVPAGNVTTTRRARLVSIIHGASTVARRATMIHFEQAMRKRGTDFSTMLTRQPWNKSFDYELLDAFIQRTSKT